MKKNNLWFFLILFLSFLFLLFSIWFHNWKVEKEKREIQENIYNAKLLEAQIIEDKKNIDKKLKAKIAQRYLKSNLAKIEKLKNDNCLYFQYDDKISKITDKIENDEIDKKTNFTCLLSKIEKIKEPENLQAIYINQHQISRIDKYIQLAKNTKINAFIIDIKEVDGKISFEIPKFLNTENFDFISTKDMRNPQKLIQKLHKNKIYTIARIVVFKDNYFTKKHPELAIKNRKGQIWKDYKGHSYLDPTKKKVWERIIKLAKISDIYGFDEINFDYIRYPSDGKIEDINLEKNDKWSRVKNMDIFFDYLTKTLKKYNSNLKLSADIFGYTVLVNGNDLKIGQIFEDIILYFDRVSPMIYPSHYGKNLMGIKNPDSSPYLVIKINSLAMEKKIKELNKKIENSLKNQKKLILFKNFSPQKENLEKVSSKNITPWIQAFNCYWCSKNWTPYQRKEIQAQITALRESKINDYFVWNPASRYKWEWFK